MNKSYKKIQIFFHKNHYFIAKCFIIYNFFVLLNSVFADSRNTSTGLEKLINQIFTINAYNHLVRPVDKDSGLTFVATELKVLQIDLDEKYQELLSTVWIEMTWTDSRLSWNPEFYDNITEITLPVSKIWVPDIVLQNGVGRNEYLNEMKYFNPWIGNTGVITWVPEIRLYTRCLIKVSDFPFDTQCCEINFYSWAHTIKQMQINQYANKNVTNVTHLSFNTEWQVYHTCANNKIIVTNENLHWWVTSYIIYIKRHTAYHIYTLIMPCFVLSMLSILLFLLPPDSGEKVTLGVTILLAFFVNSLVVSNYTPEAASDLPVIGVYYVFNIGLVSVSVGTSVCVLNFHFRGHKVTEVPLWIKKALLIKHREFKNEENKKSRYVQPLLTESFLRKSFLYEPNTERKTMINSAQITFMPDNEDIGSPYANGSIYNNMHNNTNQLNSSRLIDFMNRDNESTQSDSDHQMNRSHYPNYLRKRSKSIKPERDCKNDDGTRENLEKIIKILKRTTKMVEKTVHKKRYIQEIYDDWKEVASRLDFILFLIASTIVIVSPMYLFGRFLLRDESQIYISKNHTCGCNVG